MNKSSIIPIFLELQYNPISLLARGVFAKITCLHHQTAPGGANRNSCLVTSVVMVSPKVGHTFTGNVHYNDEGYCYHNLWFLINRNVTSVHVQYLTNFKYHLGFDNKHNTTITSLSPLFISFYVIPTEGIT